MLLQAPQLSAVGVGGLHLSSSSSYSSDTKVGSWGVQVQPRSSRICAGNNGHILVVEAKDEGLKYVLFFYPQICTLDDEFLSSQPHHLRLLKKIVGKGFGDGFCMLVGWVVAFDVPPYLCIHPHTCCNVIEKLQWLVGLEQVALPSQLCTFL